MGSKAKLAAAVLCCWWPAWLLAQTPASTTPSLPPDARFATDILLVVAHPDDDVLVGSYLAKAIRDEHRSVAVVFGTRGDAGGNEVGNEQAGALAAVREIEARRALRSLGVENVWFLEGRDTASQDVLRSLENWGHGRALEQVVRLVRLSRPKVVLTWLPRVVAGENHGDHQAAGVIATEAFDLAGDPTAFPAQVAPPRDRTGVDNLTEGLRPWQPQKLYYFSDASSTAFLEGRGPRYPLTEVSSSERVPYGVLALRAAQHYATQFNSPDLRAALERGDSKSALTAVTSGDEPLLPDPLRFVLGKSHVGGTPAGDAFENVTEVALPFMPPTRPTIAGAATGISLELGAPWAFYSDFWRAHRIDHLAELGPHEIAVRAGSVLRVPVLIRNPTLDPREVRVGLAALPAGWSERSGSGLYAVGPQSEVTAQIRIRTPGAPGGDRKDVICTGEVDGRRVASVTLLARLTRGGLAQ